MKLEFYGKIGTFVEIDVLSPEGKTIDCKILHPSSKRSPVYHRGDNTWLDVTEDKKIISFKHVGNNDNSCSIKILNLKVESFGKWQIITVYKDMKNVTSYKRDTFTLINA